MPFEPAQAPPPASDVALRRLCGGSNAGDVNLLSRSSNVRQAEHRAVRLATRRGSTGLTVATLGSASLPARRRRWMRGGNFSGAEFLRGVEGRIDCRQTLFTTMASR